MLTLYPQTQQKLTLTQHCTSQLLLQVLDTIRQFNPHSTP